MMPSEVCRLAGLNNRNLMISKSCDHRNVWSQDLVPGFRIFTQIFKKSIFLGYKLFNLFCEGLFDKSYTLSINTSVWEVFCFKSGMVVRHSA